MDAIPKALHLIPETQSDNPRPDLRVLEELWEGFEKIADEGGNFIIKLDGGRPPESGLPKRYTVIVSGGKLQNESFREDSSDLVLALSNAVIFYAERVWNEG